MPPVKLLIIGAGSRGTAYAEFAALHPELAQIVGVAEPREFYRRNMAERYRIPAENIFDDWQAAAAKERMADAAIITTQDALHVAPAVAFARKGYHLLLEKPLAPDEAGCREIVKAIQASGILFAVGHILRYTDFTQKLKALLDAGTIGDIVNIQHLEPVGYWHQAHSFVRGNWRNEAISSPMLLAKSCHDLDWLRYIIGRRCLAVSSFGTLKHFRPEMKPDDAADRCLDCTIEPECPYSAVKIYLGRVRRGERGWPVDILAPVVTEETIMEALRLGPYGRCVYACDNDVVDHQVVSLLFDGDITASFTMTGFTEATYRRTRIFGTRGEIEANGKEIRVFDFLTDRARTLSVDPPQAPVLQGHGGGDYRLMQHFIRAVAQNDPSEILSGPQETLETHLMVFAAEQARRENRVVALEGL